MPLRSHFTLTMLRKNVGDTGLMVGNVPSQPFGEISNTLLSERMEDSVGVEALNNSKAMLTSKLFSCVEIQRNTLNVLTYEVWFKSKLAISFSKKLGLQL